ncbi:MAG: methyltransferase domain-containing protein [Deltaproteobacteria bacterium]|nr:methyltransferase domain-containing protein [Deltaproteobacteria bacterium]
MLICPVCTSPLSRHTKTFECPQRHTFDIAKEGYVNLLVSKKGVSRPEGDHREMLHARREVLGAGHFAFLQSALFKMLEAALAKDSDSLSTILDVGCGEGYYLGTFAAQQAAAGNLNQAYFGFDASKEAVRLAAKSHPGCTFFLADVFHSIPIATRSVSAITVLFSPRNFQEFARILKATGNILIAIPTPDHFKELREYFDLLKIEEEKEQRLIESAAPYVVRESHIVEAQPSLTAEQVHSLLTMSPNFRHTARMQALKPLPASIPTTLSVQLLRLSLP